MASYTPAERARMLGALYIRISSGESLEGIASTPGWPSRPTLRKWIGETPGLAQSLAEARGVRRVRERFPFSAHVGEMLLRRVRLGEPLGHLIRQPGMPRRRELNAWKRQNLLFAAELEDAKAFADHERRRYRPRRSRLRYSEAIADRIILAVHRGATMPQIYREPHFPTRLGMRRWRHAEPVFAAALESAQRVGHAVRRRDHCLCTPRLMARIEHRIIEGASLHSLSKEPGMPGLFALYQWVRTRADFAAMVAKASTFRDEFTLIEKAIHAETPAESAAVFKRLGQLNPYPGEGRG
ncbi:MAG TPA: hypothetical protein VFH92_07130 [Phenylobacterium sp.]|nr:hypothetical protein [Phenylobacterium sp.]